VIEPDLVVALGSPVPGVIRHIAVERGDVVEEGQVLVELEAGPEKAAVALAQARAAMTSEIRASEASLGLGERQAARNEQLLANRAVSVTTKDEAVTEAVLARLRLDQARENRRLAELELGRAQAALDQRILRSPVRGVVMERLMAPGELVSDQPVMRLGRIDPLKVEVIAPADLYGSVRRGMRAEISPEMPGRGSFAAEVRVVDPVIDAASGTFGVSLELPNPEHGIPGGLRCKVRFLPE
jgi:RND family efflux transporter MFP subunit